MPWRTHFPMKWILETLLLFAAFFLGLRLMGAVVAQRDAEVWLRQPDGSQLHLQGAEVSHPLFGGLQVRTPDGHVMTYPDAALVGMKFEPQPYSWPEKLKIAGIFLAVLAVWLVITWPELRWLWERLDRRRW
jgi:hypothetical protein